MGDVIGPEVLVRKRAQKHLDKVNQLIKKATLGEIAYLLQLRLEHEETIRKTYIKGESSNEHRDTHPDVDGGDSETQWTISPNEFRHIDIDGDILIGANDDDGAEADKGNKTGDPDDTIV